MCKAIGLLLVLCLLCSCKDEMASSSVVDTSDTASSFPASDTVSPPDNPSVPSSSSYVPSVSTGGVSGSSVQTTTTVTRRTAKPSASRPPEKHPSPPRVRVPAAPGKLVHTGSGAVIDASNAAEGYVMIKCVSNAPRIKVLVVMQQKTYQYNLNTQGNYEVIPLSLGSGQYLVRIMENIADDRYRQLYAVTLDVRLADAFLPFLYPNQYVDFSAASAAVKKTADLCADTDSDLDKIESIYRYVTKAVAYDYEKAKTVQPGYLPRVDDTLHTGKGICFDYAALVAAMLRAQNIPAKLVIGAVSPGDLSHAWNLIYTREKGWIAVKIQFRGGVWELMDATFGASMGQNVADYIGDGGNYTPLRFY